MRVLQRILVVALLCSPVLVAGTPSVASGAVRPAGTDDSLAEARRKVAEAKEAANDAAAKVSAALQKSEELAEEIDKLETRIADGKAEAAVLREQARRRAVNAYTGQDQGALEIFESGDPDDVGRRSRYLDDVNARDNDAVDELAALEDDLEKQKSELESKREEHDKVLERLEEEREKLDGLLAEATEAADALAARLAQEQIAAAAAPVSSGGGGGGGRVVPGLVCPVPGAAFSDDYGAPRSGHTHQGNDLFAPAGTPNYAVIDGTVSVQSGGAGGNMLYLAGSDGNVYFYAHLQSFVVSSGSVSQGQLVATTGSTGNATTPHTHFEIRVDGTTSIDPYPTLSQIC